MRHLMSRRDWIPLDLTDCARQPRGGCCHRRTKSAELAVLALTPNSLFSVVHVCFAVQIIVLHGNQRFSQIVSFDDAQGKSKSGSLVTSSPLGLYVIDCLRLVRHPSFIIKSTISRFPARPMSWFFILTPYLKRNHESHKFGMRIFYHATKITPHIP